MEYMKVQGDQAGVPEDAIERLPHAQRVGMAMPASLAVLGVLEAHYSYLPGTVPHPLGGVMEILRCELQLKKGDSAGCGGAGANQQQQAAGAAT